MNIMKKANAAKLAVATGLMALAVNAHAEGDALGAIGEKVAAGIGAFIGVVSAIGMASITVIVAIQGFKLAWGMIRTIK